MRTGHPDDGAQAPSSGCPVRMRPCPSPATPRPPPRPGRDPGSPQAGAALAPPPASRGGAPRGQDGLGHQVGGRGGERLRGQGQRGLQGPAALVAQGPVVVHPQPGVACGQGRVVRGGGCQLDVPRLARNPPQCPVTFVQALPHGHQHLGAHPRVDGVPGPLPAGSQLVEDAGQRQGLDPLHPAWAGGGVCVSVR